MPGEGGGDPWEASSSPVLQRLGVAPNGGVSVRASHEWIALRVGGAKTGWVKKRFRSLRRFVGDSSFAPRDARVGAERAVCA